MTVIFVTYPSAEQHSLCVPMKVQTSKALTPF